MQNQPEPKQQVQKGWLSRWTRKQWSRHWFVLKSGSLTYYRGPAAELCSFLDGVLDLSLIKHIEVQQQQAKQKSASNVTSGPPTTPPGGLTNSANQQQQQPFTFSLRMWNGECHLLGAASLAERSLWLEAINRCANGCLLDDEASTDSASSTDSSPTSNLSTRSCDIGLSAVRYRAILSHQQKQQQQQQQQNDQIAIDKLAMSLRTAIKRREQELRLDFGSITTTTTTTKNNNNNNSSSEILKPSKEASSQLYHSTARSTTKPEPPALATSQFRDGILKKNISRESNKGEKLEATNEEKSVVDVDDDEQDDEIPTNDKEDQDEGEEVSGEEEEEEEGDENEMEADESEADDDDDAIDSKQAFKRRLMCVAQVSSSAIISKLQEPKLMSRLPGAHHNDESSDDDDGGPSKSPTDQRQQQAAAEQQQQQACKSRQRKRVTFDLSLSTQRLLTSSSDSNSSDASDSDSDTNSDSASTSSSQSSCCDSPSKCSLVDLKLKPEPMDDDEQQEQPSIKVFDEHQDRNYIGESRLTCAPQGGAGGNCEPTGAIWRPIMEGARAASEPDRKSAAAAAPSVSSEAAAATCATTGTSGPEVAGESEGESSASDASKSDDQIKCCVARGEQQEMASRLEELELRYERAQESISLLERRLSNSCASYAQLELTHAKLQGELAKRDEFGRAEASRLQARIEELQHHLAASELKLLEARDRLLKFEHAQLERQHSPTLGNSGGVRGAGWLKQLSNQQQQQQQKPLFLMHHVRHTLVANQQTISLKLLNQSKQIQRKLNELELKVDKINQQAPAAGEKSAELLAGCLARDIQ